MDLQLLPDLRPAALRCRRPISRRLWKTGKLAFLLLVALALWLLVELRGVRDQAPALMAAGYVVAFSLAAFLGLVGTRLLWSAVGLFLYPRRNIEATSLLNAGRFDRGAERLDLLVRRSRFSPRLHVVLLFNLARALQGQGRSEEAARILNGALRSGWTPSPTLEALEPVLALGLAACLARSGDLDRAEALADATEPHLDPLRRLLLVDVRALVALRRGEAEEALALIDAAWEEASGQLEPAPLRALGTIRAFALDRLGRKVEAGEQLASLSDGAAPDDRGLTVGWPEMQRFLERAPGGASTRRGNQVG